MDALGQQIPAEQPFAVTRADEVLDAPGNVFFGLECLQHPNVAALVHQPAADAFLRDDDFQLRHHIRSVIPHRQCQLVPAGQLVATGDFVATVRVILVGLMEQHQLGIHHVGCSDGA
ncbi:hypothetical protein D9M68_820840 [compost metagenome]